MRSSVGLRATVLHDLGQHLEQHGAHRAVASQIAGIPSSPTFEAGLALLDVEHLVDAEPPLRGVALREAEQREDHGRRERARRTGRRSRTRRCRRTGRAASRTGVGRGRRGPAIARGVNARLTSWRKRVWSGGSIQIIIGVGTGSGPMSSIVVACAELNVSVSSITGQDVVVAAERVEVELLVSVERRLVAQAFPHRLRVDVDVVVVRVVVEVGSSGRGHAVLPSRAPSASSSMGSRMRTIPR